MCRCQQEFFHGHKLFHVVNCRISNSAPGSIRPNLATRSIAPDTRCCSPRSTTSVKRCNFASGGFTSDCGWRRADAAGDSGRLFQPGQAGDLAGASLQEAARAGGLYGVWASGSGSLRCLGIFRGEWRGLVTLVTRSWAPRQVMALELARS
jgi:hypothetical protein